MNNFNEINIKSYLKDLMSFVKNRIDIPNGDSEAIEKTLSNTFFQPFHLMVSENIPETQILQVRIAIEALRGYTSDTKESEEYLKVAYQTLLTNLGTSHNEIRLINNSNEKSLENRLGIDGSDIRKLNISPANLKESNLEAIFGLKSTIIISDEDFIKPPEKAKLITWQLNKLNSAWIKQDGKQIEDSEATAPAIDPDIVSETDLKNPVIGNLAYDLLKERKKWLDTHKISIKTIRESQDTQLKGFNAAVKLVLGDINLLKLHQDYVDGENINLILSNSSISLDYFLILIKFLKLAEEGIVTAEEWEMLYNILTQVQKIKLKFKKQETEKSWAMEELEKINDVKEELILGPDFFVQYDVPDPNSDRWQLHWRTRRDWENKLEIRIKQRNNLITAHQQMIETTEEITLPLLRNYLIKKIEKQIIDSGSPLIDVADWLTQRLSISFKYSGEQKISRIEQGIETLQDMLLAFRSGRLNNLLSLPISKPFPKWKFVKTVPTNSPFRSSIKHYTETLFDVEWKWMGSYSQWLAAMFVHYYPENYLSPILWAKYSTKKGTDPFVHPSPNYQELLHQIRTGGSRLNSELARELASAHKFSLASNDTFRMPKEHDFIAPLTDEQLTKRREDSKVEISAIDAMSLKTIMRVREDYFFTPMLIAQSLQKNGEYLAALDWYKTIYAYNLPLNLRKIDYFLEKEESTPTSYKLLSDWAFNRNGLSPFDIANKRANSYTQYTILSITRCFLAYADSEFTRETNESIPLARRLYFNALNLLNLFQVPKPITYWLFEIVQGEQIPTLIQNNHTLIINGANLNEEGRYIGRAISFDGTNGAKIAYKSVLSLGRNGQNFSITFALYLRRDAHGSPRVLLRKGAAKIMQPFIGLDANNNQVIFKIGNEHGELHLRSESSITLDEWNHVACIKQGNKLKILINGQLDRERIEPDGNLVINSLPSDDDSPVFIGEHPEHAGIDALLDEIYIFDQALSIDAIMLLAKINDVPPNPVISSLRQHAEANLQKIRNNLNIAGMERIRANIVNLNFTTNEDTFAQPQPQSQPNIRPTIYRYAVLIERSKQLVNLAQQIETSFLGSLEKRDGEAYSLREANQDVVITRETVELQDLRVNEAQNNISIVKLQRNRTQIQASTYHSWLNAGPNQYEQQMLGNYVDLKNKRNELINLERNSSLLGSLVAAVGIAAAPFTAGASLAVTAYQLGSTAAEAYSTYSKAGINRAVNSIEASSQINTFLGSHQRRKDEWALQEALSNKDLEIANRQINQAVQSAMIMAKEMSIANTKAGQAEADVEFLKNKFTNLELYEWMSDILSGIYSYFLQQATATAQLAANQLSFERQQRLPAFINNDYWQAPTEGFGTLAEDTESQADKKPDRRGLTGSARLLQDIYKLDQYAFETNQRKQQLVEGFSLARLFPFEFQQFRETGILPFSTSMDLFDQGFPGHYLRLIKQVRISVLGLIPPLQGIRATLSSSGISRVVIGGAGYQKIEINRPPEAITFTSPSNANGLFELQANNELLLPFESMGVDASWELKLPKAANRFDFDSIADVIFTMEYTALHSFDYQKQVIKNLDYSFSAERPYSIKQDHPDLWYQINNPEELSNQPPSTELIITLERSHFPPNLESLKIDSIVLFFVGHSENEAEIKISELNLEGQAFEEVESVDGIISTRKRNSLNWQNLINKSPIGSWRFVFPEPPMIFKERFSKGKTTDILFVLGFSGETPPWL